MARGSCLAGKIKAGILGLALLGGMALPAHADGPAEVGAIGVCLAHHGLHVPQHFQHQPEPRRAGRIRSDLRHVLRLRVGIEHRISGRTSSSTTVSASRRNGARSPSTSPASITPFRALTARSTTSRRWAARAGPPARGPLASRTIGRRITSSFLASLMRSRAPLRTPGPTSCGISSRPASAAPSASSRTRKMPTTTCTGMPA